MKFRVTFLLAAVCCALAASALPASAEIVFLTSGRTLSVKEHRVDGDSIVLTLRSGSQVTCDKTLIEKIVADEVPHPDPVAEAAAAALAAQQVAAQASSIDPAALLSSTPYGEIISAAAEAHGVDPLLVRALIQVESGYKPTARSAKGALGLMQLMPSTAKEYRVRNPFDPKANIEAGVKHLKSLIDGLKSVELALAAYNAGEGAVKKFGGIPPYRETRDYVTRILSIAGQ